MHYRQKGSPYWSPGTATPVITGTTGGTFRAPAGVSIAAGTGIINLATSTPGTYTITYSFNSGGCSNTATTSITINALPTERISLLVTGDSNTGHYGNYRRNIQCTGRSIHCGWYGHNKSGNKHSGYLHHN